MAEGQNAAAVQQEAAAIWAELKPSITHPTVVVLMGVSGSGKTTIAALLAAVMHWEFQEGDDLHPPENVAKMSRGVPLDDADRAPWLAAIAAVIDRWRARGASGVLTCSALKRAYRDVIVGERPGVVLVYLQGSHDVIAARMAARHEHFMPTALLDSQFSTLQEPTDDEHPVRVDVGGPPHDIVARIVRALAARERAA